MGTLGGARRYFAMDNEDAAHIRPQKCPGCSSCPFWMVLIRMFATKRPGLKARPAAPLGWFQEEGRMLVIILFLGIVGLACLASAGLIFTATDFSAVERTGSDLVTPETSAS